MSDLTITIKLSKNEKGHIIRNIKIVGGEFRFYEMIAMLEMTKIELIERSINAAKQSGNYSTNDPILESDALPANEQPTGN